MEAVRHPAGHTPVGCFFVVRHRTSLSGLEKCVKSSSFNQFDQERMEFNWLAAPSLNNPHIS